MDDLAHGPPARPIRRVELRRIESRNGGGQARRSFRDLGDELAPLIAGDIFRALEFADRIP